MHHYLKQKLFLSVLFLALFFIPFQSFAWHATGHKIIAQIAYDHLTPKAKKRVNQIVKDLAIYYPNSRSFDIASDWPDMLKFDDVTAFDHWHFINIPFSADGTPLPSIPSKNVVWAIGQSEKVLASAKSNKLEKALFLRFLIHFVGDVHQPLHSSTRVSAKYPKGDLGGNLYPIHSKYGNNLHYLWDEGDGIYAVYFHGRKPRPYQLRIVAKKIQRRYPESYFGSKISDTNPHDWAMESFYIAKRFAYQVPFNGTPTRAYLKKGQRISEQRFALAGYRLAYVLNQMF